MMDQLQVSCAVSDVSTQMFDQDDLDKLQLEALDVNVGEEEIDKLLDNEATEGMFTLDDNDVQLLMQHDGQRGGGDPLRDVKPSGSNVIGNEMAFVKGSGGIDGENSFDALFNEAGLASTNSNDSIQRMVAEAIKNGNVDNDRGLGLASQGSAQRASLSTSDLEIQKMMLLKKLDELKQQKTPNTNNAVMQQVAPNMSNNAMQQQMMMRNNANTMQQQQQKSSVMHQALQQRGNALVAPTNQQRKSRLVASVASVQSMSSGNTGGESALQSFLRGSRKSMNEGQVKAQYGKTASAGSQSKPASVFTQNKPKSVLSQAVAGAPPAASIFSKMSNDTKNNASMNQLMMDMETIHSQSELNASLSLAGSKEDLFASFGRSTASSDWLRQLSAKDLMDGASKRSPDQVLGQEEAAYASSVSARRKSADYARSGMIKRNASEGHIRKAGLVSRGNTGRLSRENSLRSLMVKKQLYSQGSDRSIKGPGGRLSRDNSLLSLKGSQNSLREVLLPSRRAQPSAKHSLGLSRHNSSSVPHMRGHLSSRGSLNSLRGSSPGSSFQKNAMWG